MKDLIDVISALQPVLLVTLTGTVGLIGTLQGVRMERRRVKESKLFDRHIEGGAALHGIVLKMLTTALDVINMPLIPDYLRTALSE